jgi:hypothetical protein
MSWGGPVAGVKPGAVARADAGADISTRASTFSLSGEIDATMVVLVKVRLAMAGRARMWASSSLVGGIEATTMTLVRADRLVVTTSARFSVIAGPISATGAATEAAAVAKPAAGISAAKHRKDGKPGLAVAATILIA